jgi:hypothetical protein
VRFNEEWMRDFTGPKYVMFYDKLNKDLKGEMRRLMKFLDAKYNEMDYLASSSSSSSSSSSHGSFNFVIFTIYFSCHVFNE